MYNNVDLISETYEASLDDTYRSAYTTVFKIGTMNLV